MFTAELGAWVESDVAKKNGQGMRKVWVAGAKAQGENVRLSVIEREGDRERHTLTLYVHTPEARAQAREALTLALKALDAVDAATLAAVKAPAKAPAAPKAPTPPTRPQSQVPAQNSRKSAPAPAPVKPAASGNWFADLMAQAGA